jgi:TRAP-type mannitol/chloroaromatic compound transport system substrate-binding protein
MGGWFVSEVTSLEAFKGLRYRMPDHTALGLHTAASFYYYPGFHEPGTVRSPSRNAAMKARYSGSFTDAGISMPIRRIPLGCCARG